MPSSSPIVILDSGLGGLTVARALRRQLPSENLLYFGDTARVPYGSKTASTITGFVREIISYFRPQHPKHVVIACNTATALALPIITTEFPDLHITGVIEPGAIAAIEAAGTRSWPTIGIIATDATIRSEAYERAILKLRPESRLVTRAAPLLVPIIEEGRSNDDPLVQLALEQYLHPLTHAGIDVLVLGCTHYPILKDLIVQQVGPSVRVIDSADYCAQDVASRLRQRGLLQESGRGSLSCFVTDDPLRFSILASRILDVEVPKPTWVSLDDLHSSVTNAASARAA